MTDKQKTTYDDVTDALYDGIPLLQTALVRDGTLPTGERPQMRGPTDVATFLIPYFATKDREEFVVIFLDQGGRVTGMHVASVGGLACSIVEPRQVFKAAVLANAATIVVAHNHPSGSPTPSREDIRITKQLVEAGKILGIPVHDHLIIAEGSDEGFTSLAEHGYLA